MIVSLLPRGIGAAALAAGLMLAGCSSDSDVPPTIASAPGGGTQVNTDTGSGGTFPDINTVPNERPTSTIQDLTQAPEGLSGAQSGTQYGEALVGGPSSSVAPPEPPPPPEPQEELAPIPEPGLQTQTSGASSAPIATPEVVEPQPMEPMEPVVAQAPPAPGAPEGQTIQGTMGQPAAQEVQPAPMAAEPQQPEPMAAEPQQPAPPVSMPQPEAEPEGSLAAAPDGAPSPPLAAAQQAQLPARAYGYNYRASAPEAYGIAVPQPVPSPHQAYNPAQALHPANYGGVVAAPVVAPGGAAGYGQPYYAGQPVGLIYFRNGSSDLSSDDRRVLKEMADMQRAYGGVVNVIGHASIGAGTLDYADDQANQRVSEARADAVGRQLMSYGVPQDAIRILAVGASQPLYSEAMPTGEAANRRAEVYLSAY